MTIKCGICNNDIEITNDIIDGQHVLCPYCENKTAFSRPSRIELPEGFTQMTRHQGKSKKSDEQTRREEKPVEINIKRPKPIIGVRHSTTNVSGEDLNAVALKRRIKQEEIERIEAARAEKAAQHKLMIERLKRNSVIGLVLLILGTGGGYWFYRWNTERLAQRAQKEAEVRLQALEEQKRIDAERAENERKRNAIEAERQVKREAELKVAAERKAKAEAEYQAREQKRLTQQAAFDDAEKRLEAVKGMVKDVRILPWFLLEKNKRPGAVDGVFRCIVPIAEYRVGYFEVISHQKGFAVQRLVEGELPSSVANEDYLMMVEKGGALVGVEGNVYFLPPKSNREGFPVVRNSICPGRMCFGGALAEAVVQGNANLVTLNFSVMLKSKGVKNGLEIATVGFDETIDGDKLVEKVRAQVERRKPFKMPKQKAAVVWYDGNTLKRDIHGTMLVPRNPQKVERDYDRYADEAERYECEQKELLRVKRAEYEENISKLLEKELENTVIIIRMTK